MSSSRQLPLYVWPFCYNPRNFLAIPLIPIRGLVFLVKHPELWNNVSSVIIPQVAITMILFGVLYVMFFTIQIVWTVGVLCLGPLGPFLLFVNFLHQVDAIAQRLGLVFFYQLPLDSLFDYVYATSEERKDAVIRTKIGRLQKYNLMQTVMFVVFELPRILISWPTENLTVILTLWMMAIPGIGPIISVLVEAPKKGRSMHQRYFELKGLTVREMHIYNDDMWWHYYLLGMISGFLELVPFVSTLFVFTNRTGAAMWASDLENYYRHTARQDQENTEAEESQ